MSSPLDGASSMVSRGVSAVSEDVTSLRVSTLWEVIVSSVGGDWMVLKSDLKVSRDLTSFWRVYTSSKIFEGDG